ncbi:MAG TPA: glycoside hydrolase family 97 protein [Ohtaekwangia sp.]|uniref:glycoside hydrolase family 97 protein n=1 Tax=Ohtaekwangia sp. TaxID=2066019 RepID=UPI002F9506A5
MKKILLVVWMLCAVVGAAFAKEIREVTSPDGKITIRISVSDKVYYSVTYKGQEIVAPSAIALVLENKTLGIAPKIKKTSRHKHKGEIALLYGNFKKLDDRYNELVVDFTDSYSLVLRAYNDGVAYRFKTAIAGQIKVMDEVANFNITGNPSVIYPETDVFTSWEVPFVKYPSIGNIPDNKRALTPVMFSTDKTRVLVGESDVLDYPGMYLKKTGDAIKGAWANYPKRTEMGSWGNFVSVVKETENYIAQTNGTREFPWRVIIPTDDDRTLLTNDIVYKLAKPLAIPDVSWIKPGKAAWEWWHDAIVEDAGIPTGMDNRNTALYKHYIDFAAANHIEYLMLDAGWSNIFDLSKVNPKIDMKELIQHGKDKHVDVFLWCVATTLVKDLDKNMDLMQQWGVAGLKVDFFDRDDQLAIKWFEDIAAAAAKHKLMVNFHGCSKPTGLERAYPNIVNYEAVRGAECSKWDFTANPDHHLLIPFIRMIAGPLDYTPGSMRNKTKEKFKPVDPGLPSSQGTRCHELAMYVVFDQPFAMLCDAPAEYRKYPDIMKYLSAVPTAFDDTKILDAKVGEYVVMAKKKGNDWFVGAMSNWNAHTADVDFSFLPAGESYTAEIYTDAQDANIEAAHYIYQSSTVNSKTKLSLPMAQGGGAVIYLHK